MRKFSVWHDHQDRWDPSWAEAFAVRCQARSFIEAAEKVLSHRVSNYGVGAFIVRDDEAGTYHQIELVCGKVQLDVEITLEELRGDES